MSKIKQFSFMLCLAIVVCLACCLAVAPFASAEDGAGVPKPEGVKVYSSPIEIDPSTTGEYAMNVYAQAHNAFASYDLTLSLPSFLEVKEVKSMSAEGSTGTFAYDTNELDNTLMVSANYVAAYNGFYGDQVGLFSVRFAFKAGAEAEACTYAIDCEGQLLDKDNNNVYVEYYLGALTVIGANTRWKGDWNGDGIVTLSDVMGIQQYIAAIRVGKVVDITDAQYYAADIDRDGDIDIADCQYIHKYLVGDLTSLESINEPEATRTVYITDSEKWGDVYGYVFDTKDGTAFATWPGVKMEYYDVNEYNETVYVYSFPYKYNTIVFSNGNGTQTVDVALEGDVCQFYISKDEDGKYLVYPWDNGEEQDMFVLTNGNDKLTLNTPNLYTWEREGKDTLSGYFFGFGISEIFLITEDYQAIVVSGDIQTQSYTIKGEVNYDEGELVYGDLAGAYTMIIEDEEEIITASVTVSAKGAFRYVSVDEDYVEVLLGRIIFNEDETATMILFGWNVEEAPEYSVAHVACDLDNHVLTLLEEEEPETVTLYFSNNKDWNDVYVYAFNSEEEKLAPWPGIKMDKVGVNEYGERVYSATILAGYKYFVLNSGFDGEQTIDIPFDDGSNLYWLTVKIDDGRWEVESTYTDGQFSQPEDWKVVGFSAYYKGDPIKVGNYVYEGAIVAFLKMSNGKETKEQQVFDFSIEPYDNTEEGSVSITIKYQGYTATFEVQFIKEQSTLLVFNSENDGTLTVDQKTYSFTWVNGETTIQGSAVPAQSANEMLLMMTVGFECWKAKVDLADMTFEIKDHIDFEQGEDIYADKAGEYTFGIKGQPGSYPILVTAKGAFKVFVNMNGVVTIEEVGRIIFNDDGTATLITFANSIEEAEVEAVMIVDCDFVEKTLTMTLRQVYFSNNKGWDNVFAYYYDSTGTLKSLDWPGSSMYQVGTNAYGETIYTTQFPAKYDYVIFSNGAGQQTVNIALSDEVNQYWLSEISTSADDAGKWLVGSGVYSGNSGGQQEEQSWSKVYIDEYQQKLVLDYLKKDDVTYRRFKLLVEGGYSYEGFYHEQDGAIILVNNDHQACNYWTVTVDDKEKSFAWVEGGYQSFAGGEGAEAVIPAALVGFYQDLDQNAEIYINAFGGFWRAEKDAANGTISVYVGTVVLDQAAGTGVAYIFGREDVVYSFYFDAVDKVISMNELEHKTIAFEAVVPRVLELYGDRGYHVFRFYEDGSLAVYTFDGKLTDDDWDGYTVNNYSGVITYDFDWDGPHMVGDVNYTYGEGEAAVEYATLVPFVHSEDVEYTAYSFDWAVLEYQFRVFADGTYERYYRATEEDEFEWSTTNYYTIDADARTIVFSDTSFVTDDTFAYDEDNVLSIIVPEEGMLFELLTRRGVRFSGVDDFIYFWGTVRAYDNGQYYLFYNDKVWYNGYYEYEDENESIVYIIGFNQYYYLWNVDGQWHACANGFDVSGWASESYTVQDSDTTVIVYHNEEGVVIAFVGERAYYANIQGDLIIVKEFYREDSFITAGIYRITEGNVLVEVSEDEIERTIYFSNNMRWNEVYAYFFNDNNDKVAEWPGVKMVFVEKNDQGEDVYKVTVSGLYNKVVFNNNSSMQTVDITLSDDVNAYYVIRQQDENGHFYFGTWIKDNLPAIKAINVVYTPGIVTEGNSIDENLVVVTVTYEDGTVATLSEGYTVAVTFDEKNNQYTIHVNYNGLVCGLSVPVVPAEPEEPEEPETTRTVYFSNNGYWNAVYAYVFNSEEDELAAWPGVAMTYLETNEFEEAIYSYSFAAKYAYIIFNDGGNGLQTVDIELSDDVDAYYTDGNNEQGKLEVGSYKYGEVIEEDAVLVGISASYALEVIEEGTEIDPEAITVTSIYSDGSEEAIVEGYTFTQEVVEEGIQVTVVYVNGEASFTASFIVAVVPVEQEEEWDGIVSVKFDASISWFTSDNAVLYAYVFYTDESDNGVFPGVELSVDEDGDYSFVIDTEKEASFVIISRYAPDRETKWNQTSNISARSISDEYVLVIDQSMIA